ncbi:DsbA family protein [Actinomadura sp. NPDC048394]|uniref:DsbA family oxidoreductase n=1 Tax=Actinomadura sp. NPDC048394 TaxID=3158223 RepID=UPI00340D95F1
MKVEIWAEIACPWCGLGGHRLGRAVERFEHSGDVEVVHRSFPLRSGLPEDRTLSVREYVLAKYGAIPGQGDVPDIEGMAAAEGLAPYRVLADRRYRRQVQQDAHQAQRLGATGAPFTVIDGRYALAGAQDTDTLLGVLRQVWDQTRPTAVVADNGAATCGPDGCAVPADHAAHA